MDSYPSKICPEKTKATWCLGCRYLCWRVGCPSDLLICWHDAVDSKQMVLTSAWKWWTRNFKQPFLDETKHAIAKHMQEISNKISGFQPMMGYIETQHVQRHPKVGIYLAHAKTRYHGSLAPAVSPTADAPNWVSEWECGSCIDTLRLTVIFFLFLEANLMNTIVSVWL